MHCTTNTPTQASTENASAFSRFTLDLSQVGHFCVVTVLQRKTNSRDEQREGKSWAVDLFHLKLTTSLSETQQARIIFHFTHAILIFAATTQTMAAKYNKRKLVPRRHSQGGGAIFWLPPSCPGPRLQQTHQEKHLTPCLNFLPGVICIRRIRLCPAISTPVAVWSWRHGGWKTQECEFELRNDLETFPCYHWVTETRLLANQNAHFQNVIL